jgi:catalase
MKDEKKKLTTGNGAPVVDNQNTMTARDRVARSSCRMSGILRNCVY